MAGPSMRALLGFQADMGMETPAVVSAPDPNVPLVVSAAIAHAAEVQGAPKGRGDKRKGVSRGREAPKKAKGSTLADFFPPGDSTVPPPPGPGSSAGAPSGQADMPGINMWETDFDYGHPDLEAFILSKEVEGSINGLDLEDFVQKSFQQHLQQASFMKFMEKVLLPDVAKTKEKVAAARQSYAALGESLKIAEQKACDAEGLVTSLKDDIKKAEDKLSSKDAEINLLKDKLKEAQGRIEAEKLAAVEEARGGWLKEKKDIISRVGNMAVESFDSAVNQIKVRNSGLNLDLRGISAYYVAHEGKIYSLDRHGNLGSLVELEDAAVEAPTEAETPSQA